MSRPDKKDILSILVIITPLVLFFSGFFFPRVKLIVTPDFGQSDAVISFATKNFYAESIRRHTVPLWTSMISGGHPIYGSGIVGTWYLPNLILFYTLPSMLAYNLSLFLAFALFGIGMFAWYRSFGFGRPASVFGSVALSLSGYMVVQMTHLIILQSISLIPFLGIAAAGIARHRSWARLVLFIFLYSQLCFIGLAQGIFIVTILITAYFIWLPDKSVGLAESYARYLAGIAFGLAVAAIQLVPSVEYLSLLLSDGSFSPRDAAMYSFPFSFLITLLHPFVLGNPRNGSFPSLASSDGSIFWENTVYTGLLPLFTAVLWGAYPLFRKLLKAHNGADRKAAVFFGIMLVVSLLLMTGKYSPLYFLYSFWPFTIFRVPSRFVWIFIISYVSLATVMYDMIMRSIGKRGYRYAVTVCVVTIHLAALWPLWYPYHYAVDARAWLTPPALYPDLTRKGNTLTIGAERAYNDIYAGGWSELSREATESFHLRNTFIPHASMLWDVPHINDYMGRFMKRSNILTELLQHTIPSDGKQATVSASGMKTLSLLGISDIISVIPVHAPSLQKSGSVRILQRQAQHYVNPEALPKAYLAGDVRTPRTVEDAVGIMISDSFTPGTTIITEKPIASVLDGHRLPEVVSVASAEGRYTFAVTNVPSRSVLVITETYAPGWKVSVDGQTPTAAFPVNIKHIGSVIPAGSHTITAYYLPDSYLMGRTVTALTLTLIAILTAFSFFRRILRTRQTAAPLSPGRPYNRGTLRHGNT